MHTSPRRRRATGRSGGGAEHVMRMVGRAAALSSGGGGRIWCDTPDETGRTARSHKVGKGEGGVYAKTYLVMVNSYTYLWYVAGPEIRIGGEGPARGGRCAPWKRGRGRW